MAYYYSPFRKQYVKKGKIKGACPFCNEEDMRKQVIRRADGTPVENEYYRWVINLLPKFEGHTMVVPKKHITEFGTDAKKAVAAREELSTFAARALQKLYPGAGIEIFLQYGGNSMASMEHLHWHIVPALPDDKIRGFEKLGHFYTTEKGKEQFVCASSRANLVPFTAGASNSSDFSCEPHNSCTLLAAPPPRFYRPPSRETV